MKIAIIGSGGREFTIGWKLSQSKKKQELFFLPGNGGTNKLGQNINISLSNFEEINSFIVQNDIEMVIVGPEAPLVDGLVDFLETKNIPKLKIIGPSKQGALLEGSKAYAKEFMQKYNIPTAKYKAFNAQQLSSAIDFLKQLKPPYVLKADGLAAGKGVLILDDIKEAEFELKQMFDGKFGNAGNTVVIEEFLDGIELSVFVLTDGENYKILPQAKDYKRIGDGDSGLNTGGMGAVSPVPFANAEFLKKIEDKIIVPTIEGIKTEKIKYNGFVFFGLIKVKDEPFVIEYNVRMGDPETQAVLPRIENDFVDLFLATANKQLDKINLNISDKHVVSVVVTSGGYPENYENNFEITGIENVTECLVLQAGTKSENNKILTSGGRVLAVTGFGNSIESARKTVYSEIKKINFNKMYFRKDIGLDLL
ncbi:MAG: phosphoribosylamine--glycine ligase [Bacteroidales bacterium]|nr:phosphoribosylamine--glycine ligase [Bacteroidales bacterium]